jgi:hypothetical protein
MDVQGDDIVEEQRDDGPEAPVKSEMTAAELFAYQSLPADLRHRKEYVEESVSRISDFLRHVKEFGEELVELGYSEYSEDSTPSYDCEHVTKREALLGPEYAGELNALQVFDQVHHKNIRREVGRLGKDFVKKVTALQQLMESLSVRFNKAMLPFTRSKEPELAKFEREMRQRMNDITYLTRQHTELVAAAQDAKAGDEEETNSEIEVNYQIAVQPLVDESESLSEELSKLSRLSFRKRRSVLEKIDACAQSICDLNEEYSQYDFIDFVAFEPPQDDE